MSERSGGIYCSECDKCITPPRKRKIFREKYFMICDECSSDVCRITCRHSEDSVLTDFKIKLKDIPSLIKLLEGFCDGSHREINPVMIIKQENLK